MSALLGVAEATGRGLQPESHTPARPPTADAVASTATQVHGGLGAALCGGPERRRGEARRRAPSRPTMKLLGGRSEEVGGAGGGRKIPPSGTE